MVERLSTCKAVRGGNWVGAPGECFSSTRATGAPGAGAKVRSGLQWRKRKTARDETVLDQTHLRLGSSEQDGGLFCCQMAHCGIVLQF